MKFLLVKLNRSTKLTISVFLFSVVLKLLLHYAEFGFFEFILFDYFFGSILFVIGIAILLIQLFSRKLNITILAALSILAITFLVIHFGINTKALDFADWKLNYSKREKIVQLIKEEGFNSSGRTYRIPSSLTLFPYIKSNEVNVVKQQDTTITVEFYTDRGLMDHYTAFVYSNDSLELKHLTEKIGGNNKKMAKGWFYVNH